MDPLYLNQPTPESENPPAQEPDGKKPEEATPESQNPEQEPAQGKSSEADALREELARVKAQIYSPEYQQYLQELGRAKQEQPPAQDPTGQLSPEDLDQMSGSELAKTILNSVARVVEDQIKPVTSKLTQVEFNQLVDAVARRHPDFWDYKDQMIEIAKQNPNMHPEAAYKLAKFGQLESKVSTLEESLKTGKAREGASASSERPGSAGPVGPPQSLSPDKAAEKAWEDAFGSDNA